MELVKRFESIWLLIVMIGALNWGLVGLFDFNLVEEIFGSGTGADVVYVVIGVAALVYLPRLFEAFHFGHRPHPRGV
jgi:uncharacterized protein